MECNMKMCLWRRGKSPSLRTPWAACCATRFCATSHTCLTSLSSVCTAQDREPQTPPLEVSQPTIQISLQAHCHRRPCHNSSSNSRNSSSRSGSRLQRLRLVKCPVETLMTAIKLQEPAQTCQHHQPDHMPGCHKASAPRLCKALRYATSLLRSTKNSILWHHITTNPWRFVRHASAMATLSPSGDKQCRADA